jgi:hypothetical protein
MPSAKTFAQRQSLRSGEAVVGRVLKEGAIIRRRALNDSLQWRSLNFSEVTFKLHVTRLFLHPSRQWYAQEQV